jgi:hypothetical protein
LSRRPLVAWPKMGPDLPNEFWRLHRAPLVDPSANPSIA